MAAGNPGNRAREPQSRWVPVGSPQMREPARPIQTEAQSEGGGQAHSQHPAATPQLLSSLEQAPSRSFHISIMDVRWKYNHEQLPMSGICFVSGGQMCVHACADMSMCL